MLDFLLSIVPQTVLKCKIQQRWSMFLALVFKRHGFHWIACLQAAKTGQRSSIYQKRSDLAGFGPVTLMAVRSLPLQQLCDWAWGKRCVSLLVRVGILPDWRGIPPACELSLSPRSQGDSQATLPRALHFESLPLENVIFLWHMGLCRKCSSKESK